MANMPLKIKLPSSGKSAFTGEKVSKQFCPNLSSCAARHTDGSSFLETMVLENDVRWKCSPVLLGGLLEKVPCKQLILHQAWFENIGSEEVGSHNHQKLSALLYLGRPKIVEESK